MRERIGNPTSDRPRRGHGRRRRRRPGTLIARREVATYLDVVAELDRPVAVDPELLGRVRAFLPSGDHRAAGALLSDELLDRFAFAGTPAKIVDARRGARSTQARCASTSGRRTASRSAWGGAALPRSGACASSRRPRRLAARARAVPRRSGRRRSTSERLASRSPSTDSARIRPTAGAMHEAVAAEARGDPDAVTHPAEDRLVSGVTS